MVILGVGAGGDPPLEIFYTKNAIFDNFSHISQKIDITGLQKFGVQTPPP